MDDKQMREAFARIIANNPMVPSKEDPEYDQWLFRKAWKAACAAAMERAAVIAAGTTAAPEDWTWHGGTLCADAIRAEIPGDRNA